MEAIVLEPGLGEATAYEKQLPVRSKPYRASLHLPISEFLSVQLIHKTSPWICPALQSLVGPTVSLVLELGVPRALGASR